MVDATLTHATGTAEREATLTMLDRRKLGGRKRARRTTHHPGYAVSQRIRKRVEEVFG